MHEVSIMQSALEAAERHAKAQGATRIHRIVLKIGEASGVVPYALEFAFKPVTDGTMADGATLEIIPVPVVCRCADCHTDFPADGIPYVCPTCGEYSSKLIQGTEMDLASLEIS